MDVIFVHGALVRDGGWWWRRTAALIAERTGVTSRAVVLPSCGETTPEEMTGGLTADAAALRHELAGVQSAIVVGHSYGGTVIAEAGAHPAVSHLVYVSSYLPEVGQPQGAILSGESDPVRIADNGDGTLSVDGYDVAEFGARFLQDVDGQTQSDAWDRVTAQAVSAFTTPTTASGWRGVDSTYLLCADDRSTTLALQRFHAERATRQVELPTGHHPFLSRPDLVAREIEVLLKAA